MAKKAYRVCNWKQYNKSLIQRGSLTFWFSQDFLENWHKSDQGQHGNTRYSDMAILTALTLRQVYRLTLRSTQGMVNSLIVLCGAEHAIAPCFSTLSRRSRKLKVNLGIKKSSEARHVLVDSTGVQVIGEGEWKKLCHGQSKHQLWRKLHIAVDADEHEILSASVTESVRLDGNYLPGLIDQIDGPIKQITGDGAYDKINCYETAYARQAKPVFPPQHNACVQRNKYKKNEALNARDKAIEEIGRQENRKERLKEWKEKNNYHRRSLVETMMSRMKNIFGDQIRSKMIETQTTDLLIRCYAINKMNKLGMPQSEAI